MITQRGVDYSVYSYRGYCADLLAYCLSEGMASERIDLWLNAWREMDRLCGEAR